MEVWTQCAHGGLLLESIQVTHCTRILRREEQGWRASHNMEGCVGESFAKEVRV